MAARSIFRQVTLGGDAPTLAASSAAHEDDRPLALRDTPLSTLSVQRGLAERFDLLLGVFRPTTPRPSLLDLGCGPGLLLDHLRASGRDRMVSYTGIDTSQALLEPAARLWPEARFFHRDILETPFSDRSFDYVLVNGLPLDGAETDPLRQHAHARRLIEFAFRFCRIGAAFNLAIEPASETGAASTPRLHDTLLGFLTERVTRHVVLRGDCGLPYHTVYLYREPSR